MCIAALSLLWARNAAAGVSHSSLSSAFHALSDHDHRLCFDHEDPQWPTAPSTALAEPSPIVSSQPSPNVELPVEFVRDGWHFNRPPPVG
jgi:hypothetical protein